MSPAGWVAVGVVAGLAVGTRLVPANETSCCRRVAVGARDQIAGYTGPFSSVTSFVLDGLGLTKHLPSILDKLGVPVGD